MKQLVWRVEVSSRVDLIDGEAFTGGSGVPPLRQKGSFPCYEKRRDAASPSHDAGCSRDAKFNFYREIARYPLATTGQTVTAAPDAGIGLECDKFSRRGVDAHFDRHLVAAA